MINMLKFYDSIAMRYVNCYRAYINLISSNSDYKLRYNFYHRMQVYYKILEVIFNSIYE